MEQSTYSMTSQGVVKTLFCGHVPFSTLFPFPKISLSEIETLELMSETLRSFLKKHQRDFVEFDRKGEQPHSYLDELKELGLFGVIIPEEFGGLSLSSKAYARILEVISEYDGSTGLTIGAHSSIGMKGLLLFGTPEQKARYLRQLATGELIAAFCLTESGAGSDAQSIKTSVTTLDDGTYEISGEKIWITNGPLAGFFTVFAKHTDKQQSITAFIVERTREGVSVGAKEDKMGIRASATTSVFFDKVRVPRENRLGGEGDGFKIAMAILNSGRTGLGGGCVGAMKRSLKLALGHAHSRSQFGKPLKDFPLIQEKLSFIAARAYATESVVQLVGSLIDEGFNDYSLESAASKVYGSEALWLSANDALQVAGGAGFMRDLPYEMIVRDARINLIFEGTNEILRMYIALAGLKALGDRLKDIGQAVGNLFNEPIKGIGHISDYVITRARTVGLFSRRETSDKVKLVPELDEHYASLSVYSSRLAKAGEVLLRKHQKKIVDRQLDLKRLADSAIHLLVSLATISHTQSRIDASSESACEHELHLTRLIVREALRTSNQSLRRLIKNEDTIVSSISKTLFDRYKE